MIKVGEVYNSSWFLAQSGKQGKCRENKLLRQLFFAICRTVARSARFSCTANISNQGPVVQSPISTNLGLTL